MSLWKNSTLISPQMGIGWVTSKANPVEVFLACFKTQKCTYEWRSLHFCTKTTARLLISVSSRSMIIWASVVSHCQQQHYSWLQNENYNKKDFIGVILVIQWYLQQPTNKDRKNIWKYSQIPLLGHPLNTNTSLLETVCFVPGERKCLHFSLNSTHLIFYGNFLWPLKCLYWWGLTVNIKKVKNANWPEAKQLAIILQSLCNSSALTTQPRFLLTWTIIFFLLKKAGYNSMSFLKAKISYGPTVRKLSHLHLGWKGASMTTVTTTRKHITSVTLDWYNFTFCCQII